MYANVHGKRNRHVCLSSNGNEITVVCTVTDIIEIKMSSCHIPLQGDLFIAFALVSQGKFAFAGELTFAHELCTIHRYYSMLSCFPSLFLNNYSDTYTFVNYRACT